MTWAPLFLTFLIFCIGSMAHTGLTQQPTVTQTLEQIATFTCIGNSNTVGYHGTVWMQQHPGHTPKSVMARDNNRPFKISDRFSGSRSDTVASLTIFGLRPEDEADYNCAAWDRSLNAHAVLQSSGAVRHKPNSFPGLSSSWGTCKTHST